MKQARLTLGVLLSMWVAAAVLWTATGARADYAIKDGNAANQNIKAGTLSGGILPWYLLVDATGTAFGTSGNPLSVNANPGTPANWGIGGIGTAVPANAHYWGINVAGSQAGVTGLSLGATVKAPTVAIVDASGNQITSFGGAGGTASNFGSVFPTPGTAVGFSDGTNMVAGRVVASGADATANATPSVITSGFGYVYNGTTWDRTRGDVTNGMWVNVKTGAVTATQSGTWTVQPGNTANTVPWLFAGNVSNAASAVATSTVNAGSIAYNYGYNGATWDQLQVDGSKNLKVNCTVGCSGGTASNAASAVATSATNLGTIAYGYGFNGTTWDQFQMDASKFLKVNCAAGCTGAADTTAPLSAMTALNAATSLPLVGTNSLSVLLSGTWVGTLIPEVSADGGTTWVATRFYNVNTHTAADTVTTNGTYDILGTGGKSNARVRLSAFTSGTVTGNLRATSQAPSANDAQAQLNLVAAAGTAITGATAPTSAYLDGGVAQSAEPAVATAGNLTPLATDLAHKLITLPYANPENFVSGSLSSAMTLTTSVSLIAAPAAGLRNYITSCTFSNSHATVGTDIILQDGSGGTQIWLVPAAAVYGGAQITFPTPLRQPTTATALFVQNVTTGASTKASCAGYKGA